MSDKVIACNLTFDEINRLANMVESGSLSKIKIKNGDSEIVIEKELQMPQPPINMYTSVAPSLADIPPVPAAQPSLPPTTVKTEEKLSGNVVKAPIVGTYYSKPAPDKKPFVEIGTEVKKGDVLMIIESMKLMNEVQSEFNGVVKEILVKDGDAVEYDQPIMIIE